MIRFFFRALGLALLAVGFVFFVYDGTKSIAGNRLFYTPLSETWNSSPCREPAGTLQPMIERYGASASPGIRSRSGFSTP